LQGLLDDVRAHRVALGMAAIRDTREREDKVDLVTSFSAGSSIVVRKGNPQGILELGDLGGETVAVERATVQVDLLERAQQRCDGAPIRVSEQSDNGEALLQLRTRRAVAVLND
jgi:polar amino acid transport system substrate-binding protein